MKSIIFGRNAGNTLGQIRNFGEMGMKSIVVWYGNDHHKPTGSRYTQEFYEVNGIDDGIDFIIKNFAEPGKKHLLSTDNDGIVGALNHRYDELKDYFYFFNAGEKDRLNELMPKEVLCVLAEECGLKIPKTELVDIGVLPTKLKYPIFTKSADSFKISWKESVSICRTESDLVKYYEQYKLGKVLLQEYIEKKNEFILQGVSVNDGKDVFIPIQGSYYRLPDDAYGSFLHFERSAISTDLYEKLKRMFEKIRYSGVFEIEFLQDKNDELYFLEINFRHTLWTHTFTDMGMNLSRVWAEAVVAGKIVNVDGPIHEPHKLMNELIDFKRYVVTRKMKLSEWIRDFKSANSYVFWDSKDKMPCAFYVLRVLAHRLGFI